MALEDIRRRSGLIVGSCNGQDFPRARQGGLRNGSSTRSPTHTNHCGHHVGQSRHATPYRWFGGRWADKLRPNAVVADLLYQGPRSQPVPDWHADGRRIWHSGVDRRAGLWQVVRSALPPRLPTRHMDVPFVVLPFFIAGLLAGDLLTAILLFIITGVAANYVIGPTIAMIQMRSPVQMRAVSWAIMMLCLNLIGMGLGPLLVGVLSDLLAPQHSEDALSVALALFTLMGLWGSVHFWLCGRALARQQQDLEKTGDSGPNGPSPSHYYANPKNAKSLYIADFAVFLRSGSGKSL